MQDAAVDISFDTEELDRQLREDVKKRLRKRRQDARSRAARIERMMGELDSLLGACCAVCGSMDDLEVDHVDGRDWQPRQYNSEVRLRRYLEEFKRGVRLRRLCSHCNGHDGQQRALKNRRKRGR